MPAIRPAASRANSRLLGGNTPSTECSGAFESSLRARSSHPARRRCHRCPLHRTRPTGELGLAANANASLRGPVHQRAEIRTMYSPRSLAILLQCLVTRKPIWPPHAQSSSEPRPSALSSAFRSAVLRCRRGEGRLRCSSDPSHLRSGLVACPGYEHKCPDCSQPANLCKRALRRTEAVCDRLVRR
jgi:hypothetical protein